MNLLKKGIPLNAVLFTERKNRKIILLFKQTTKVRPVAGFD